MLGVFLDHNPADFGLRPSQITHIGELRTGFSQAVATDLEDDSYDLSCTSICQAARRLMTSSFSGSSSRPRTTRSTGTSSLAQLSKCLYSARDGLASALDEFDAVCAQHDTEMARIRPALYDKFGSVPVIEMYRQAAIRCQKAHDWRQMRFWAARGLAVYGSEAARPGSSRRSRQASRVRRREDRLRLRPSTRGACGAPGRHSIRDNRSHYETLVCSDCGADFQRVRSRGRKPPTMPQLPWHVRGVSTVQGEVTRGHRSRLSRGSPRAPGCIGPSR